MDKIRYENTRKIGILGLIFNIILLLLKVFIGISSKSQSMIADSINSAGDIFASFMTFIGNKISNTPQDETHNFGHGKAEYIFSMFIGLSMVLVALKLLYNSISALFLHSQLVFSWNLIIVCLITILIKFSLYMYTKKISKKFNNILLKASMKDHLNDCIVSSFTLTSILLTLKNIYWFDSLTGIGISLWIGYTGIKFFIESFNILMDISIDTKTKDLILNIVNNFNEVKCIKSFSSTPVGYQYIVVLVICVDGNLSTFESHSLSDNIELKINKLDSVYKTIIHVEPI